MSMDNHKNKNQSSLWFQVEQEIVNLLLDKLEAEQIIPEHARTIAKFVVKTIPHEMTDQQMLQIIPRLDDEFFELATIVYKHLREYEKKFKKQVVHVVKNLMKQGRFQEAQELMNKYFQRKL